jgi:transposase
MATKQYKRDFKQLEARRRRGMRMLARGLSQAEVARSCEVSRQTAMTWARLLAEDPQAWRRRPLGRPGAFSEKERSRLAKLLLQGAMANGFATEVWTLARVAKLIEREFGHAFSVSYVWAVLREMGFSSQRPVGRATQRDEQAIRQWKTKRWPALKKTPDATDAPSSSSTSRD